MLVVLARECVTALHGNAHSLVVARIDKIKERERHVVIICRLGLAFEPERNLGISGHGQRPAHQGDRFYTLNALQLPQGLAVHCSKLVGRQSRVGTRRDAEREDIARIEAWIDVAQR